MIDALQHYVRCALTCAIITDAIGSSLSANDVSQTSIPKTLYEALHANSTAINGLRVTWVRSRQRHIDTDGFFEIAKGEDWIVGDKTFLDDEHGEFIYRDQKIYRRFTFTKPELEFAATADTSNKSEPQRQKMIRITGKVRDVYEIAFDGSRLFSGSPANSRNPGNLIVDTIADMSTSGFRHTADAPLRHTDYLYEAGFWVPSCHRDYQSPKPKSILLHLLATGAECRPNDIDKNSGKLTVPILMAGQRMTLEYVEQYHFALSRWRVYDGTGKLVSDAEMNDFVLVDDKTKFWLPQEVRIIRYQWEGRPTLPRSRPVFTDRIVATSISKEEVDENRFVLNYTEPGTLVGDGTLPGADETESGWISYTVPANPRDLDRVIEEATESISGHRRRRLLFVTANVGIALILTGALVWRFRNRRQKP